MRSSLVTATVAAMASCGPTVVHSPTQPPTFSGQVVSSDGGGLPAHLTITDHASGKVIDAETDDAGRFTLDLEASEISVAVTTSDQYAYLESIRLPSVEQSISLSSDCSPVEIEFVDAEDGRLPSTAQIGVGRLSTFTGDLFVYRVPVDGRWRGCLPPGHYVLRSETLAIPSGEVDLKVPTKPLRVRVMDAATAKQSPAAADATRAASLEQDLPGPTSVLGIAESNHGTAEFATYRARLAETLADRGFTWIGIEAAYGDVLAVDDYVTGGPTPLADAALAPGYFAWITEEFRDMLERLRAVNAQRKTKIRFVGFDIQNNTTAIDLLVRSARFDPEVTGLLQALHGDDGQRWAALEAAKRTLVLTALTKLEVAPGKGLDANRDALAARMLEWHFALADTADVRELAALRDVAMAAMVKSLRSCDPAVRMQLWGHVEHLSEQFATGRPTMGEHLSHELGDGYYSVALLSRKGTAVARLAAGEPAIPHALTPAPPYTIEAAIGGELDPGESAYVPLRLVAGPWIDGIRHMRVFGWLIWENPWVPMDARASFDAVVVFESTNASHVLPKKKQE